MIYRGLGDFFADNDSFRATNFKAIASTKGKTKERVRITATDTGQGSGGDSIVITGPFNGKK